MSLYVVNDTGHHYQWHVGKTKPKRQTVSNVQMVQADGDELNYIHMYFSNIPFTGKPVVRWHGDLAKFIVENL
jgi:hypothetical protein